MAAVMASAPLDRTISAFQQNRFANGNQLDPDFRQPLLRDGFGAAQARRFGHKIAVRQLRQPFARAEDMHLAFDLTVKRRDLFVTQRPVFLDAVQRALAEVIGGKTETDRVPVERAPAERPDAVNADAVASILDGVSDVVAVKRSLFEKSESALRQIVRPVVNVEVFKAAFISGFYQDRVGARRGQFFDHETAGRAGADDAYVIDLLFSDVHFALRLSRYLFSTEDHKYRPRRNPMGSLSTGLTRTLTRLEGWLPRKWPMMAVATTILVPHQSMTRIAYCILPRLLVFSQSVICCCVQGFPTNSCLILSFIAVFICFGEKQIPPFYLMSQCLAVCHG